MKGQVALVREQGQEFAVLLVRPSVVTSAQRREEMIRLAEAEFGRRAALLAENGQTYGPEDIVNWLRGVYYEQLPWRDFWLN